MKPWRGATLVLLATPLLFGLPAAAQSETSPEVPEPSPEVPEPSPEVPEPSPEAPETSPEAPETSPEVPETSPEEQLLGEEPQGGEAERFERDPEVELAAEEPEALTDEVAGTDEELEDEEAHQGGGHFRSRLRFGDPERIEFSFPGEYALRLVGQSDMELSAVPTDREDPAENLFESNELGQNFYLLHWWRIRPELRFLENFRLVGQMDLLHGHIAGDDTMNVEGVRDERSHQEGLSAEGVRPRWLFLEWTTPIGLLRLGQMGSNWGLGLLANDGDRAEGYLFGDHRFGDLVERVVFFTKPFYRLTERPIRELAFFLGGDVVFDDGTANLVEGDLAWQLVGGLLWRLDAERALGLYVAYRNQTYEDGDHLEVTAIDVYGQWSLRLAHEIFGYAEGELVGVVGTTDAAPNFEHSELEVRQLGFAARVGLRLDGAGLDVRLEGGYASGDADTNDDRIGRFTFDPDFRVGLIIFQELLAWSTARAAVIAASEELVGEPQEGLELLPTEGGVAGASYLYPSVSWRPLRWLDLRVAFLVAQATSDVISPFETKRRGQGSSFRGAPGSNRDLGFEIDLSVSLRWDLEYVELRGGVEAAYCVPGRAFDDAEGNRMNEIGLIRGRLQIDW